MNRVITISRQFGSGGGTDFKNACAFAHVRQHKLCHGDGRFTIQINHAAAVFHYPRFLTLHRKEIFRIYFSDILL